MAFFPRPFVSGSTSAERTLPLLQNACQTNQDFQTSPKWHEMCLLPLERRRHLNVCSQVHAILHHGLETDSHLPLWRRASLQNKR